MSGYTPGPWSYYTTPQPNGCPVIGSSNGLMVAMLSHSVNEESQSATALANARLIAAAPDLLEALILARELFVDGNSACAEICDEAIAKATEAAS